MGCGGSKTNTADNNDADNNTASKSPNKANKNNSKRSNNVKDSKNKETNNNSNRSVKSNNGNNDGNNNNKTVKNNTRINNTRDHHNYNKSDKSNRVKNKSKNSINIRTANSNPKDTITDNSNSNNNNNNNNISSSNNNSNSNSNISSSNSNMNKTRSHKVTSRSRVSGTQSKYIRTDTGSAHSGEAATKVKDSGYNKRLRDSLVIASQSSDIAGLETAVDQFERHRLQDGGDLTKARYRLDFLKLRKDLKEAIQRRHVGVLERIVSRALASPHAHNLTSQIEAARNKIAHLKELNKYSHDILAMDQSTISELHAYHRPPASVHDVMAASYMLLGHEEETLRSWEQVQSMTGRVGRNGLIHRVKEFDSSKVDERMSRRVKEIISYHRLDEVRTASNGAATFYVWASNIVNKIDKDTSAQENQGSNSDSGGFELKKGEWKREELVPQSSTLSRHSNIPGRPNCEVDNPLTSVAFV